MEDGQTPRMHKYGESKTTRIMEAALRYVTSGVEYTKFQATRCLLQRVNVYRKPQTYEHSCVSVQHIHVTREQNAN